MKLYSITVDGLETAVQTCPLHAKHAKLLDLLRSQIGLNDAALKISALRNKDRYWHKRKLLTADGQIMHDDAHQWVREQLKIDGQDARACFDRLCAQNLYVSRCELEEIYFTLDRNNDNPADFVQVCVYVENEFLDCPLFESNLWSKPTNEKELLSEVGSGSSSLPKDQLRRVRPSSYKLGQIVDVGLFVDEAEGLDQLERANIRARKLQVTNGTTGETRLMSADELDPKWDALPFKLRRLFNDWSESSAGRSGARFCEHWLVSLSDYIDYKNQRSMNLVPMWTFSQKLAEVAARKGDSYDFMKALSKLDLRVGVSFGWYFFMLHGNRVKDGAGERLLQLAETGVIDLPEHDYQVLKRWQRRPYGF